MSYGMYLSAAGAHTQSQRIEILTNNLANTSTPGFKREFGIVQARHSEAIARGDDYPGTTSINNLGGGVELAETATDFSSGAVKSTERDLDFAILGDGFFMVEKDGERYLTRAGNFHLGADGRLLTDQGHRVLSDDGAPIALNPAAPFSVEPGGWLQQAGERIALGLVRPESRGDLAKAGENLFALWGNSTAVAPEQRQVVNRQLELSSANPIQEQVEMIEASRVLDANIRLMQQHDQTTGSLINRLLKAS